MTVSPNQPQDGPQGSSSPPSGTRPDAAHTSDPLPPTLFALPNLRAETAPSPVPMATPISAEAAPLDEPSQQLRPLPYLPADDSTSQTSTETVVRYDEPVVHAALSSRDRYDRARAISDPADIHDSPSQKTLLDRVGSHAIVLVMLLIVFGIALLAGRKSVVEPTTPLATQEKALDEAIEIAQSETLQGTSEITGAELGVGISPASVQTSRTTNDLNDSVVSTPVADINNQAISPSQPSAGISASTVSARSENTHASDAASSTAINGQVSDGLQAESTPVTSETLGESEAAPPQHRYSKTPRQIEDWSRYLPVDASYVMPTSATTSQP